jgi:hypothetical protein
MNTAETSLPLRAVGIAQLLLQAVIVPGARTSEGKLIEAVTVPWFDIIALLKQAGAAVAVGPYTSRGRNAAILQFPGGPIAEVHALVGR